MPQNETIEVANAISGHEWVKMLCGELVSCLGAVDRIAKFSTNGLTKGHVAEACIRDLIARFVAPLRVSHGTILYEGNAGNDRTPEIDVIVWQPSPLPPIFEAGSFAIVPRGSAVGYLEVKRTLYSKAASKMAATLLMAEDLIPDYDSPELKAIRPCLGVVCLLEQWKKLSGRRILERLKSENKAVVLLEQDAEGGAIRPNHDGVLAFANFLDRLRLRARLIDGRTSVVLPASMDAPTASSASKVGRRKGHGSKPKRSIKTKSLEASPKSRRQA